MMPSSPYCVRKYGKQVDEACRRFMPDVSSELAVVGKTADVAELGQVYWVEVLIMVSVET